jgi:signal transduction histidine kinase
MQSTMNSGATWHAKIPSAFRPGRWLEIRAFPLDGGVGALFRDATRDQRSPFNDEPVTGPLPTWAETEEMALLDEQGVIISANEAWRAAMSDRKSVWEGALYCQACHEIIPDLDEAVLRSAVEQLAKQEIQAFTHAYKVVLPNGQRLRQVRISWVQIGGAARLIAIHEDLDVVARANAALLKTTEQLLSAQEDERQRIAVELHDSTGQHLTAVGLGVARLRQLLTPRSRVERVLNDMSASLGEAHREIRVLSYLLRPPSLPQGGLGTAARRFVKGFGNRAGLRSTYLSEGLVDAATADVQHVAFRMIQEALTNVHRHAEATEVEVELGNRNGELTVRIADDGRGIEALKKGDLTEMAHGVGIAGMRARVEQLGGTLDIRCDGVGTTVFATIPTQSATERASGLGPLRGAA